MEPKERPKIIRDYGTLPKTMRGPLREPPGALRVLIYIMGGGKVPGSSLFGPWKVCRAQNRLEKANVRTGLSEPILGPARFPRPE